MEDGIKVLRREDYCFLSSNSEKRVEMAPRCEENMLQSNEESRGVPRNCVSLDFGRTCAASLALAIETALLADTKP